MDASDASKETTGFDVVKEGNVQYHGKQHLLQLTKKGLAIFSDGEKKTKSLDLPWCDIITVKPKEKGGKGGNADNGFCLHYMHLKGKKLKVKSADLCPGGETSSEAWIPVIKDLCTSVNGRPRKLFVLVNPFGGSGNGRQTYEKTVRPIFELADIQLDVHFTERANHGIEMVEKQDFSSYDGIALLGGDGTYNEALVALTTRTQKSAGLDYDDTNTKLKGLDIPIAVLPAGTGNAVSDWLNGVIDVTTATLRILKGEQHRASVFTVHCNGKLHSICGLLLGYGMVSDLVKETDGLRWMKRARYPYTIIKSLFSSLREFRCSLEYQQAPVDTDGEQKEVSGDGADTTQVNTGTDSPWIKHEAKAAYFSNLFMSVGNAKRQGDKVCINPWASHVPVLLNHGTSTLALFKSFIKFIQGKDQDPAAANADIIERVKALRVKLVRDPEETDSNVSGARAKARSLEQLMNVDGESDAMEVPEFEVRVVPSYAQVYGINQLEMNA